MDEELQEEAINNIDISTYQYEDDINSNDDLLGDMEIDDKIIGIYHD